MDVLKEVTELKNLLERKAKFNNQLNKVTGSYFKRGAITFKHDFQEKGTEDTVEFNKEIIKNYLEEEIKDLEDRCQTLIKRLNEN